MGAQAGSGVGEGQRSERTRRDAAAEYRRLTAVLAGRARRLGSRDPESAAQETLRRSLEDRRSAPAVEYYFSEELAPGTRPTEWPLDQLLAWLHAVLHYVVSEERSRAGYQREDQLNGPFPDQSEDPLACLIRTELQGIVTDCLRTLDREQREVLKLRGEGMKYKDIAARLGVNENTVATWISRGIQTLGRCARCRMERTR